jgi:excisionase family DNA binding protein
VALVGEAMDMLGISKATLHRWVEQGKLTPLADMGGTQRWFARGEVELLRNKNM